MARLQLRRYIWLIDTIRSAGSNGITFEEINRKWMRSILNEDGKPLPLRTFHDQRAAILDEFYSLYKRKVQRSHFSKTYALLLQGYINNCLLS